METETFFRKFKRGYTAAIYTGGLIGFMWGNYKAFDLLVKAKTNKLNYSFAYYYIWPVIICTGVGFAAGGLSPVILPIYVTCPCPKTISLNFGDANVNTDVNTDENANVNVDG